MKHVCIVIVIMTLVSLILLISSVGAQLVGWVERSKPPDAFRLIREDKEYAIKSRTGLLAGDQLVVVPEKCPQEDTCTILINLCEEQMHLSGNVSSAFPIPNTSCKSSSWPKNLMDWAAEILGGYEKISWKIKQLGREMGGTGAPLSLPVLGEPNAHLTAGTRTFSLFWHGGEKPYQVRVYQEGNETPLIEQQNLQDDHLQQAQVTLSEGTYTVEVRDGAGDTATGTFQVVSASMLPVLPPEFGDLSQQSTLAPNIKDTLFALWLIEEHEDWEFEAYQLAAPLAGEYYPALLVRQRVEWQ